MTKGLRRKETRWGTIVVMMALTSAVATAPVVAAPPVSKELDPVPMVTIPAGEFWMGRTHTASLEQAIILERDRRDDQPAHKISTDAFYLDKYEVTNAEYARFAEVTKQGGHARHVLLEGAKAGDTHACIE